MERRERKRNISSVIGAWISVLFVAFFFYFIGGYVADWWTLDWWVWIILGFSILGAISTTFRYLANRGRAVPDTQATSYYGDDSPISYAPERDTIHHQPITSSISVKPSKSKYCKYCGTAMETDSQYCPNCGAPPQ